MFGKNLINFLTRFVITQASLLCLYLTTFPISGMNAINWVGATDAYSYLTMATASPGFPAESVAFHFAQRWVPHYLIGAFANYFDINIGTAYLISCFVLCELFFWIALNLLLKSTQDRELSIVLFLLAALSPFAMRLFIFVPELLADLVFMLGTSVVLFGLLKRNVYWIIFGAIIGTAGKQLFLLLLPGVALYVWSIFHVEFGRRWAVAMASLVVIAAITTFWLLAISSNSFAFQNSITGTVLFAVIPWFFSEKFSHLLFQEHLLRIMFPLAPFFGMLLIFWVKKYVQIGDKFIKLLKPLCTVENISLALLILGPIAYAFLPGPVVQMGNQSRYVGINLLPMALLTSRLLPNLHLQIVKADYWFLGAVLCAFSYHHRYTLLQSTPKTFLVIHILALIGFLIWFNMRGCSRTVMNRS